MSETISVVVSTVQETISIVTTEPETYSVNFFEIAVASPSTIAYSLAAQSAMEAAALSAAAALLSETNAASSDSSATISAAAASTSASAAATSETNSQNSATASAASAAAALISENSASSSSSSANTSASTATTQASNASASATAAAESAVSAAASAALSGNVTVVTKTTNYTALITDDVILVDATSGNITIALPAASIATKALRIKKIDSSSNAVTIDANGSEVIDGALTFVISDQYLSVTIVSNGSAWSIL